MLLTNYDKIDKEMQEIGQQNESVEEELLQAGVESVFGNDGRCQATGNGLISNLHFGTPFVLIFAKSEMFKDFRYEMKATMVAPVERFS